MADEKIYTNIGHATAYAYAKSKGYTGTEDQFATDQANFAANAQQVREDKESVETTVATFGNTTVPAAVQTVTAEGTRQVGIVGTAGDTQVERVQAEGTTQKNAVQAKGYEVIASIPSDYTELTEEVEDLKSSISSLDGLQNATWEVGNISAAGNDIASTTRGRTSTYIPVSPDGTHIIVSPKLSAGIYFALYYYDASKTFLSSLATYWTTLTTPNTKLDIVPTEGAYVRIAARTSADSTVTESILASFKDSFSVYTREKDVNIDGQIEELSTLLIEPINFSGDITENVPIIENYYLNATGGLSQTTGAATTEFIAVEPGDVYEAIMITSTGTQWIAWGRYAERGSGFIRRDTVTTPTETSGSNKIFKIFIDIPPDESQKSIRISFGANYASYSIRKIRKNDKQNLVCKSVNHRGYNTVAPENTLQAFNLSKQYGFSWIETDVQFTHDNVAVLLHDDTINRTARNDDGSTLPSTIDIKDIDYDDLLTYDFGIYKGSAYAGIRISTLAEGLSFCKKIGLNVRLELKSHTVDTSNIASIISIIEASGMSKNIELASFDSSLILYIDSNYPLYDVSLIQTTINSTLINTAQTLMSNTKHKTSCCVSLTNTEADLNLLAETGVTIDLFTIETVANALSVGLQAISFTTNRWDVGALLFLDNTL